MNPLPSLPVFVRLAGVKAVLAGSGDGAAWKAELIAASGADLQIFSAAPSPKLRAAAAGRLIERDWREADLEGARLAVAEAENEEDAERFRAAARRTGALVNVVDRPKFCDFSFGSVVERSPLVIAVSTDGAAPVFAQAIRSRIEAMFPESLRGWAQAARQWRGRFSGFDIGRRRAIWTDFADRALASVDRPPTEDDFAALSLGARSGRVVVVGVGSGAPDLLTLRAVRALQAADLVVEDGRLDPAFRDFGRREAALLQRPDGAGPEDRRRAFARAAEGATVVVLVPGEGRGTAWETAGACEVAPGVAAS